MQLASRAITCNGELMVKFLDFQMNTRYGEYELRHGELHRFFEKFTLFSKNQQFLQTTMFEPYLALFRPKRCKREDPKSKTCSKPNLFEFVQNGLFPKVEFS